MPYILMHDLLPELAEKETRSIMVQEGNSFGVPAGDYGLLEMYCNDEDCDCRRVFFTVVHSEQKKPVAVITFGWESRDFYAKWITRDKRAKYSDLDLSDKRSAQSLYGAHLNITSEQSRIAPAVLKMVEQLVLKDDAYVDRLKRHYKRFKALVDDSFRDKKAVGSPGSTQAAPANMPTGAFSNPQSLVQSSSPADSRAKNIKVGRNDPCPCNSGKKYKKCCMLKQHTPSDGLDFADAEKQAVPTEQYPAHPEQPTASSVRGDIKQGAPNRYNAVRDIFNSDLKDFSDQELMMNVLTGMRRMILDRKPHIKKYYKIRKLHGEVIESMQTYQDNGSFDRKFDPSYVPQGITDSQQDTGSLSMFTTNFDFKTDVGSHAFYDMQIYKHSPNMSCITEDYINKNRFRKPEKIEFLHSMLNSVFGLFEILKVESIDGYAYLREVFTGANFKITDVGLSGQIDVNNYYLGTRIISYDGVSFGTGFTLPFVKTDPFIQGFIKRQKKKPASNSFMMFFELYNQYTGDPDSVKTMHNNN